MKSKLYLLLPFMITGYGFLTVSFRFDRKALKAPNTLLVRHQECGCPCPSAFIKEGLLVVPDNVQNTYTDINKKEINLVGEDPFEPYEPELAMQDIMISGKVVGVDTVLCDPSNCQVVPVFKVEKWSVGSYYPRLWTHGRTFLIIFLVSAFLSVIIALLFIGTTIKTWIARQKQNS
jgi:hypothetical protein